MTRPVVTVHGNPSAAEVAAVVAALCHRPAAAPVDPYRRWCSVRRAARLDPTPDRPHAHGPGPSR